MVRPGERGVRGVLRRLHGRVRTRAAVLMYHRVADLDADPWEMCVSPSHFAEQMEVLRDDFRCLPLADLVSLSSAARPAGAAAVTFDDGYADNLHAALPELDRFDIPATFFLIAGAVDSDRELWWDALEGLLLQPGSLPETLVVEVNGDRNEWRLDAAATYGAAEFAGARAWRSGEPPPGPRQRVCEQLWRVLVKLAPRQRDEVLESLHEQAGVDARPRPTHRTLSSAELGSLAGSANVDIGAHTVTHPSLPALSASAKHDEVHGGRNTLRDLVDREIASFSYPFCFHDGATVAEVRATGFRQACTTDARPLRPWSDRFRIPRLYVADMDGEAFSEWLHSVVG